jgi:hypothetical protein
MPWFMYSGLPDPACPVRQVEHWPSVGTRSPSNPAEVAKPSAQSALRQADDHHRCGLSPIVDFAAPDLEESAAARWRLSWDRVATLLNILLELLVVGVLGHGLAIRPVRTAAGRTLRHTSECAEEREQQGRVENRSCHDKTSEFSRPPSNLASIVRVGRRCASALIAEARRCRLFEVLGQGTPRPVAGESDVGSRRRIGSRRRTTTPGRHTPSLGGHKDRRSRLVRFSWSSFSFFVIDVNTKRRASRVVRCHPRWRVLFHLLHDARVR